MADDKVVFDRLVIADEQGHLIGKPAEGVQQQIEQALAPVEKIPAGGAQGEVLARASNDGTQLTWRTVRDGVDGKNGRDGVDGQPGRDGTDGAPGRDGVSIKRVEPSASGRGATVVMSDGTITDVPMEVKAQWTPELQARAQGWWLSFNPKDAEAAKKEMYGVPLIHADVANLNTPIPIVPRFPDVVPERRLITIPTPKQPGVVWKIDGVEAAPGDHVIPGEDRREIILEATPEPGYVFSSSRLQFPVVFGSLQGRTLAISEDPSKRTAGTVMVPAPPEDQRAAWGARKNLGLTPNNGFGGREDVESVFAMYGTALAEISGKQVPRTWVVTDDLKLKPVGPGNAESEFFFTTGTPNATIEIDVAEVTTPAPSLTLDWLQDHRYVAGGRSYTVWLAEPGRQASMESMVDGVGTGLRVNAGTSVGTWRFEFLNLSCTITAPSGAQVTHKWSQNEDKHWGRVLGIRASNNNMTIGGFRVYLGPDTPQAEDRGARVP